MTSTERIICLCSGNICRSPMAVALLRAKLPGRPLEAIVISGGTLGLQGRRADQFARRAIAELDDSSGEMVETIEQHRSQAISPAMLERADHIIVMAPRHARFVAENAPAARDHVVPLWQYGDDPTLTEIPDPVGMDASVFEGCRDLIDNCLDNWLDEVCNS